MVNHMWGTMLQAPTQHHGPDNCDYPTCRQLCARKRDGSLHRKCEQHRLLQCRYQKNYMKRKREIDLGLSPIRARPDDAEDASEEATRAVGWCRVKTDRPSLLVVCRVGRSTPHKMTTNPPICKYHKCTRVCFIGQDNRFRAKCEYHLYRHRQYQRRVREKRSLELAPIPLTSPRHLVVSTHPTVNLQMLWDEDGTVAPIGPMTMTSLGSARGEPDLLLGEDHGFVNYRDPTVPLDQTWGPDDLEEILQMLDGSEQKTV